MTARQAEVLRLLEEGLSLSQVARTLGITRQCVHYLKTRATRPESEKPAVGRPPKLTPEQVAELLSRARSGAKQADLAAAFGISGALVCRLMRTNGIRRRVLRSRKPPRKMRPDQQIALLLRCGVPNARVARLLNVSVYYVRKVRLSEGERGDHATLDDFKAVIALYLAPETT